jgi:polyferredoxin
VARQRTRRWVQALAALGINGYLPNWLKGEIFQGGIKGVCVPGLNCYSCPSAVGACPIGALQNFMGALRFNLSVGVRQFGVYVVGFLSGIGSLVGRMPCGWVCPFGLFQELVHKIPSRKLRIWKPLTYLRYVITAVFVFALPLLLVDGFGYGQTWFCKWICPDGTLIAGIPLSILNAGIRAQLAFMFKWKMGILLLFLVWMVLSMRPFCRTTCPLGAIWGLFNKVSLFRLRIDETRCISCLNCARICPLDIQVRERPNTPDCIRCLKCVDACPQRSIGYEFLRPHLPAAPVPGKPVNPSA